MKTSHPSDFCNTTETKVKEEPITKIKYGKEPVRTLSKTKKNIQPVQS